MDVKVRLKLQPFRITDHSELGVNQGEKLRKILK
jgi:hypothetical protein